MLIYVHGYNTTFETAALDAARLSDGVKFVGETMVFSWPSRAGLLDYGYDRESAMWSRDALQQLLDGLIASPIVGHVHIVAHSIGTMLTMEALRQLYAQLGDEAANRVGAVVFASPDIDLDGFSSSVQRIGHLARKIIVVTAANDRALAVSAEERAARVDHALLARPPVELQRARGILDAEEHLLHHQPESLPHCPSRYQFRFGRVAPQ